MPVLLGEELLGDELLLELDCSLRQVRATRSPLFTLRSVATALPSTGRVTDSDEPAALEDVDEPDLPDVDELT